MALYSEAVDRIMATVELSMDYEIGPMRHPPYCATVFPQDAGYLDLPMSMSYWGENYEDAQASLLRDLIIAVDKIYHAGDEDCY